MIIVDDCSVMIYSFRPFDVQFMKGFWFDVGVSLYNTFVYIFISCICVGVDISDYCVDMSDTYRIFF